MTYGIHSDFAPQPDGAYSQGASAARYIFISGQIGQLPENQLTLQAHSATEALEQAALTTQTEDDKSTTSPVLIGPDTQSQLRQAIANLQALLCEVKLGLDDVVKVNVYLIDLDDLPIVDAVMSELFMAPLPARTVVEVSRLRAQARVEVECIACR